MLGISVYIRNPKISAATGSDPESNIEDTPESIYFKLNVERIYGRANEKVECKIKNRIVHVGFIEMKFEIWLKSVNGTSAIVMKIIA